jgi:hypothetical protein
MFSASKDFNWRNFGANTIKTYNCTITFKKNNPNLFMSKIISIISIAIISIAFLGCKKETQYQIPYTPAERLGLMLADQITEKGATRMLILTKSRPTFNAPLPSNEGNWWGFRAGFISVNSGDAFIGGPYYSLDHLVKYDFANIRLMDGTSPLFLILTLDI